MDINQFHRTGTTLLSNTTKESHKIAYIVKEIAVARGYKVDFDCVYEISDNIPSVAIYEYCSALGGISIRYLDHNIHTSVLNSSIEHSSTIHDYVNDLVECTVPDKYKMRRTPLVHDRVVLLPGTNYLHEDVNFELVNEAVRDGAYIKPHPVTLASDIQMLNELYPDRVIGQKVSGADLVRTAKWVYSTKHSELWFQGIASNVGMRYIGNDHPHALYMPVINEMHSHNVYEPTVVLNRLFSSPTSGIMFPSDDIHQKVNSYLDEIEKKL